MLNPPTNGEAMLAEAFNKKYKIILAHEHVSAKTVALALIKPKPLGVWDIMIPVIFILNFLKLKESREIFIQNQMFTKKMALEAARDMHKQQLSKQAVMAQIQSKTKELLSSVPDGIYSDDIRRQQINEIDLLIDHYRKLLNAQGADYAALVTAAYQTSANYASFLQQLKSAESHVMAAARRTLGAQTDEAAAERIESLTERMRAAEVKKIFSSDSPPQDVK